MICKSDVADLKCVFLTLMLLKPRCAVMGAECIAKYVYDKGLTDKTTFTLETLSGIKTIDVFWVKMVKWQKPGIDMGEAYFKCADIPMISDHFMFVDQGLVLEEDVFIMVRLFL